ncbi:MAG: hypothetical protein ACOYO1_09105 [Bacteroidales bacterium]
MSETNSKQTITFNIKGIEILGFNLNLPSEPLLEEIKAFDFTVNVEQKINIENKLVYTIVSIDILHGNSEIKLGSFKSAIIFEITNFDDFLDKNQIFNLPEDISLVLNSVSISTSRGLMFAQFKGTFLNNAFLPIIDPKQLKNPSENSL